MDTTITKEITVELDDERSVTLEVTVTGEHDSHYGADADGNRGASMWFIGDTEYTLPEKDDNEDLLSKEDKELLKKKLEKEIEDTDWDFGTAAREDYEAEMEYRREQQNDE